MINEISVKPKPQNKNSKIAFLLFFLASVVLIIVYFSLEKYRGLIGLGAIGFLTAAILVYTKYIAPLFFYDISFDSDGTAVFVVRRIVGKRQETLARVDLIDIYDAKIETKAERKKYKTPKGVLKYNYCPTMMPSTSCRVFMKNRYESSEVLIEVSEEFKELLLSYSTEAKEKRLAEEDDY